MAVRLVLTVLYNLSFNDSEKSQISFEEHVPPAFSADLCLYVVLRRCLVAYESRTVGATTFSGVPLMRR